MKKIATSALLTHCPNCNAKLNIREKIGDGLSLCPNCEYSEPAGSGQIVTFISSCLTEYSLMHEIDTVFMLNHKFPIRSCMEGNGLLPVLVERANHIQIGNGYSEMAGMGIPLKMVYDIKGPLEMRVILNDKEINLATALTFLCETIHEAIHLTHINSNKYYKNQICLDFLPNIDKTNNLSDTIAGKKLDAFQKAYIQQATRSTLNEK